MWSSVKLCELLFLFHFSQTYLSRIRRERVFFFSSRSVFGISLFFFVSSQKTKSNIWPGNYLDVKSERDTSVFKRANFLGAKFARSRPHVTGNYELISDHKSTLQNVCLWRAWAQQRPRCVARCGYIVSESHWAARAGIGINSCYCCC